MRVAVTSEAGTHSCRWLKLITYQVTPDTETGQGDRYCEPLAVAPMTLPLVPPGSPYTLALLVPFAVSVRTVPKPCSAEPGGAAIHASVPVAVQEDDVADHGLDVVA